MAATLFVAVTIAIAAFWQFRRSRPKRSSTQVPADDAIAHWLEHNVSQHRILPSQLVADHRQRVREFLSNVAFEGCGGLTLDDEIATTIAGYATLMLLGDRWHSFPQLTAVLVYPTAFVCPPDPVQTFDPFASGDACDLIPDEEYEAPQLGLSTPLGTILLAWDAVPRGGRGRPTPRGAPENIVLHEFAHRLDPRDYPECAMAPDKQSAWEHALVTAFTDAWNRSASGRATFLDEYAAEDPSEFFAVATEAFFERPRALKKRYRGLYGVLSDYFGLDPASWGG